MARLSPSDNTSVRVCLRVRPLLPYELTHRRRQDPLLPQPLTAVHLPPVSNPRPFTFDYVFDDFSTQQQVYAACVQPLVDSFTSGYNTTILAYGQTGSGKVGHWGPHRCAFHSPAQRSPLRPAAVSPCAFCALLHVPCADALHGHCGQQRRAERGAGGHHPARHPLTSSPPSASGSSRTLFTVKVAVPRDLQRGDQGPPQRQGHGPRALHPRGCWWAPSSWPTRWRRRCRATRR